MSVVFTIDGNDRTESVLFVPAPRKTENLNQQVDNLDFVIRKVRPEDFVPSIGDEVIVTRDGNRIFAGVIVRMTETVKAAKILEYAVTCNDYSQFLKRELVTERYASTTVGAIIADLVANYTTDGFTTDGVVGSQAIESFSFNRLNVAECLQKLADAISFSWYVDYDKDIHFFPKNAEGGPALTDTSNNYITDSLEIVEDLTQIRNSVLVQGGEAVSDSPRVETFNGDGTKMHFALANKFDSLPTVEVGGVAQTVGVEYLDEDDDFDCMWNFNQKYVRFTAGNTPASGTNNIEVSGTYLYPIVIRVPAPSSIGSYGVYEFAITDKSIRSQDEAIERALAELRTYQNTLYEGSFRSYDDGFRSGQVLNISSAQRGKDIDVLVQSVKAKMRDPEGEHFEYEVRFATLKSIGIIEYLQSQLRDREVIVDDDETLLNYITFEDTIGFTDSLAAPVTSTGPYKWSNDAGTTPNKLVWGYGTWG